MFRARKLVMETYFSMHVYLLVAVIYLACTIPLAHLAARIEQRLAGAGSRDERVSAELWSRVCRSGCRSCWWPAARRSADGVSFLSRAVGGVLVALLRALAQLGRCDAQPSSTSRSRAACRRWSSCS